MADIQRRRDGDYSLLVGRVKSWMVTNAPGCPSPQSSSRRTVDCWTSCSSAAEEDLPRETRFCQWLGNYERTGDLRRMAAFSSSATATRPLGWRR